eukprot:Gregarina_sp_Poly_1__2391@NODE_163_length_12241_cov_147_232955_g145_i0_p5_GENE_NODE_163_length_12241_cov_147_232955_g145_i0NODE_163_length_12241_cov_147_232955_g145_i0_p5_ORF_typecomplete_len426_score79_05La/PF05383_17/2_2e16DUF3223/PF11523_8/1_5e15RRM_3/PF08777_11/0_00096SCRL/PF06876_12/3_1e03SCRL/PF06876_12/1_3e03SCRL/PF06876_12/1_3_NODE_163_length_12241_cov_147_232955_g145_i01351412
MGEGDHKRELPPPERVSETEPETKKVRTEEAPPATPAPLEVDLAKVQRQVEYYLSDDNLKYDKFFHERISANSEGWLPFENILSCRRIQNLGATAEHIIKALGNSTAVEAKELNPGEWGVRRTNQTPLPALEERPPRSGQKDGARRGDGSNRGDKRKSRPADLHVGGCIVKISNIPAEASWETVKQRLQDRLPRKDIETKSEDGKKTFIDRIIQFVSTPNTDCSCYALLGKFDDDQKFLSSMEPLDINGAPVTVALLQDADEASSFIKALPAVIRKRREREIVARKNAMARRPILLGGIEWQDMDHLRESLRGVVLQTTAGQCVNHKTKNVLFQLLEYHPNGAQKLKNCVDFKVDTMVKEKAQVKDFSKCFWVVREDGSCEDFSLQKCFNHMSTNPPFVEKQNAPEGTNPSAVDESIPASVGIEK